MGAKKVLIGQTFNSLTVIERTAKRAKNGSSYWRCKCICGKEKIARSDYFTSGKLKNCGCVRIKEKDLTGKIFGDLTVIGSVFNKDNNGKSFSNLLLKLLKHTEDSVIW